MKKKLLGVLLSLAMALNFTVVSAFAVEKPTITVETAANAVEAGATVALSVSIKGNTGFTNYEWNIQYDKDRLELTTIESDLDINSNTNHPQTGFGYATCARANSYSKDAELFTLTFTVKVDAKMGNAEVKIASDNFKNNGVAIDADYVVGGVTVNGSTTGGGSTGDKPSGGGTANYEIIEGANGAWTQNSDGTLTFRANGEFDKFTGVKVDGKLIDSKNYTAKSGSTIVTLSKDYLATLSVGEHKLTVVFNDGECSTNFTVKAVSDNNPGTVVTPDNTTNNPQTGDHSGIVLAVVVLLVSGGALTVLGIAKKKAGKC